jgi:hypothetical protein
MDCIALVRAHTQPHGVSTPYWTENRHSEKVSTLPRRHRAQGDRQRRHSAAHCRAARGATDWVLLNIIGPEQQRGDGHLAARLKFACAGGPAAAVAVLDAESRPSEITKR